MSLAVIEAAVANLLACSPAGSLASRLDKENQAEALIALTVRLGVAVQEAGFGEELGRRAKLLPSLLAELEDARRSAHAAIMAQLQPNAKQPPKRVGFYFNDEQNRFFPAFIEPADVEQFVGDALSLALRLPRSVKYSQHLLRWKPDGPLQAFSEAIWDVWRKAEQDHLWGFFLIGQCHVASNPDQHRDLVTLVASAPEAFQAIKGAAESVFIGLRDARAAEGARPAEAVPVLSERQYNILVAMLEMEALSPDTRWTAEEIAKKSEGRDVQAVKESIAALRKMEFIGTKEGRGGGCWLTAYGLEVAHRIARR